MKLPGACLANQNQSVRAHCYAVGGKTDPPSLTELASGIKHRDAVAQRVANQEAPIVKHIECGGPLWRLILSSWRNHESGRIAERDFPCRLYLLHANWNSYSSRQRD